MNSATAKSVRRTAEEINAAVAEATEIELDMPPHYYLVNRVVRIEKVGAVPVIDFLMAINVTPEMLRPFFPKARPWPLSKTEDDYHRLGAFVPSEEMFVSLARFIGKPVRLTVGPKDRRALIHPDGKFS